MEISSETIKANYPQVWWAIYRQARAETLADPLAQQEMAQRHLQRTLSQPESATATAKPATPSRPVTISAEQAEMNRRLGLKDEDFLKYAGK